MHPYSTNTNERKIIPFYLACIAIVLTWGMSAILAKLQISFPWWASAPSVMGIYGLLYSVFDKFIWRKPFLKKLGIIKTPDISGKWRGKLQSSFNSQDFVNTDVKISQTWTEIEILLKTDNSCSNSTVASIMVGVSNNASLHYQYQNNPKSSSVDSMQIHYGTTYLSCSGDKLEGEYYSGRGRQNIGSIELHKVIE